MATITKELLSGSTNGKPIVVTATSSVTAVTIHTAVSGTSDIDLIHLWLSPVGGTDEATIEVGGTSEIIKFSNAGIANASADVYKILDGVPLNNSLVLKAFLLTGNSWSFFGYVNRISG